MILFESTAAEIALFKLLQLCFQHLKSFLLTWLSDKNSHISNSSNKHQQLLSLLELKIPILPVGFGVREQVHTSDAKQMYQMKTVHCHSCVFSADCA